MGSTNFVNRGVIRRGFNAFPLGMERILVPPQGTRILSVANGDEVTVVDRHGCQPCEVTFVSDIGVSDIGVIGGHTPLKSRALLDAVERDASFSQRWAHFSKRELDIESIQGILLFDEGSRPGSSLTFTVEQDGTLAFCLPQRSMTPDAQLPPTEITVYIKRKDGADHFSKHGMPTPLADTVQDFIINPGRAVAYEVKKGQYFQTIDVQGRECSDFQAFCRRSLDAGIERKIDMTTTRSMYGTVQPTPGLHAKYWNVDQEPLVEVIQTTCGRHDVFSVACTARYYDDFGYPGHINCSDNMSLAAAPYGIRPKKAWPSVNYFFNTELDHSDAFISNEPWSRPGDYVLKRALTDLVCISTACPDDIGWANNFKPTEIGIRVYDNIDRIRPSIGWRKNEEAELEETRQTAFHACFSRHTRHFAPSAGYWLPQKMGTSSIATEYWAAREKAVIHDLSSLRKFEVTGPDAERLMDYCLTRNIQKLGIGDVAYSAMCYDHGGMIDDGTVFKLRENGFRWVGGNDASGDWLQKQAKETGMDVWVRESTEVLANVAVQGRLSQDILKQVFWTPPLQPTLDEMKLFQFTVARIGGLHGTSVLISRTGFTGELGYEVFCHPDNAEEVFDAIWAVGALMGMLPLGMEALGVLRIEAGLILAGREFSDQTDPFEAGIGFTVPLKSKTAPFIGREALERRKLERSSILVGLVIDANIVPKHGEFIYEGRARIGEITSAVRSPILGHVIAMCRIDPKYADPGTLVEIGQLDGHERRLTSKVVALPHFDPTKQRPKGFYNVSSTG